MSEPSEKGRVAGLYSIMILVPNTEREGVSPTRFLATATRAVLYRSATVSNTRGISITRMRARNAKERSLPPSSTGKPSSPNQPHYDGQQDDGGLPDQQVGDIQVFGVDLADPEQAHDPDQIDRCEYYRACGYPDEFGSFEAG